MRAEPLPWKDPLAVARTAFLHETHWLLLYSGQQLAHTGHFSYLCLHPLETVSARNFSALAPKLSNNRPALDNAWFGYFGYELLHETETLPRQEKTHIALPECWFSRFAVILRFDHAAHELLCYRESSVSLPAWLTDTPPSSTRPLPRIAEITSPMSRDAYLASVQATRDAIHRGDFYQANITRKFTGHFERKPDSFAVFERLCNASPAAYSAYIRMGDAALLSSSPERFLTITAEGEIDTRPIKGTAPRAQDGKTDSAQRSALKKSEKDRAENLMIVDLMRNDLARSSVPGSVRVDNLFEVTTYATLHHMASTVTAQKRPEVSTLDTVKYAFPPGSMTGAPKIKAMEWCLRQEPVQRGIYSGALGWFGGDGACDLSVVIRTLVMQGTRFEFQVGGGIVADSEPEKEWRETLTKARGIMAALGMDVKMLEAI